MLRASSEMAVAMSAWSVCENPIDAARVLPTWRAPTTSLSAWMAIRSSRTSTASSGDTFTVFLGGMARLAFQEFEPLFEIERRGHALEHQAELHHGERHLRLDADDDRLGAPQARHVGD